jgi:hypothetical protein
VRFTLFGLAPGQRQATHRCVTRGTRSALMIMERQATEPRLDTLSLQSFPLLPLLSSHIKTPRPQLHQFGGKTTKRSD